MRMNERASKCGRTAARVSIVATAFLSYACVADDTKDQQSTVDSTADAVASETSAGPAAADDDVRDSSSASSDVYSVECGQVNEDGEPFCYVDRDTYVGWRTFHAFCHVCHAQDAVGSTFAPNLLDRMQDMNMELFVTRVNEGFTGQVGVMPPWKDDPNVNKRYRELFAYLKARASGALPPGRPKTKPKSD